MSSRVFDYTDRNTHVLLSTRNELIRDYTLKQHLNYQHFDICKLHEGFDDEPRNFEPWSSDGMTPELAPPLPNYHTTPTEEVFSGTGPNSRDKASHDPRPIPLGYRGQIQ
ncbi:hypothetical protein TNCV_3954851 [Trichonephila clavipes]|nr:hypothetical protein TNCV_3954851 [Trichonephila clavipes]